MAWNCAANQRWTLHDAGLLLKIKRRSGDEVFVLVDAADQELLSRWKWCVDARGSRMYVTTSLGKGGPHPSMVRMHQLLMGSRPGYVVDHINGNPLDNRRSNLRWATHSENARNRGASSATGYKGVSRTAHGRYTATINLGTFDTAEEAAAAYDAIARDLHGEFACLNLG